MIAPPPAASRPAPSGARAKTCTSQLAADDEEVCEP